MSDWQISLSAISIDTDASMNRKEPDIREWQKRRVIAG